MYDPSSRGETERMHWDHKERKGSGSHSGSESEWNFLFELVVPAESQRVGTTVLLYCHGDLLRSREGERGITRQWQSQRHTQAMYSCSMQHNCHSCCSCMVTFDYNALT